MAKDKMMFMPVEEDENIKSDTTIYIPDRRSKSSKTMIMIHTRIDGFEQKISVPLKTRRSK